MNDTLTGDPLMIVPIFDKPDVEPGDPVESLCYEVHGEDGEFFNLISDRCTSVNAYYEKATSEIDLNVVTRIGVKAVGRSGNRCWDIEVSLDDCIATVDGVIQTSISFDGIRVKKHTNTSRIRISVPNCASHMLVMWVYCQPGQVPDPESPTTTYSIQFLRLVVMRGLNLSPESHGLIGTCILSLEPLCCESSENVHFCFFPHTVLISYLCFSPGQFWNVPVTVEEYDGLFNGAPQDDIYNITVTRTDAPPRHFLGLKKDVTWDFRSRICYYVGNMQGGEIGENPSGDSVIEGDYTDYAVGSLFDTDFSYSQFNQSLCGELPP